MKASGERALFVRYQGDLFWAHFGRENTLGSSHPINLDAMPFHVVP